MPTLRLQAQRLHVKWENPFFTLTVMPAPQAQKLMKINLFMPYALCLVPIFTLTSMPWLHSGTKRNEKH
jgi:hypothetical protein